jgi:two-component system LytT family sensor kinase
MYTTTESSPGHVDAESDAYQRARHRVGQLRGFYSNLFSYVVVIAFLAVLNLMTDPHTLWFLWAAAGWGLGVALHAYSTFANHGVLGRAWEERKIRELMEHEREQHP